MNFLDGYIPDVIQAKEAHEAGRPSDRETVLSLAVPWDASDVPPVVEWESFSGSLESLPDVESRWWEGCNPAELFTASQEYRPNCAGFSEANAALMRTLIQSQSQFSEQKPERFNPMALWQLSKGGSVRGGQTISAMAKYGNEVGNFLASDLGNYDPAQTFATTTEVQKENASKHQIGVCLYEGSNPTEAILTACRKGFTVFIGNSRAVSGSEKDSNGMTVARLGGIWSHATAFGGYLKINGKEYVFWVNSHGNIYVTQDAPTFGCWMDEETLNRFCSSSFCDVAIVTYVESPYDLTLKPTLNPSLNLNQNPRCVHDI